MFCCANFCAHRLGAYEQATEILSPGGSLVCFALPRNAFYIPITPGKFLTQGLRVLGITASSVKDIEDTLAFTVAEQVVPRVQKYQFNRIFKAFDELRKQTLKGRLVVDLQDV